MNGMKNQTIPPERYPQTAWVGFDATAVVQKDWLTKQLKLPESNMKTTPFYCHKLELRGAISTYLVYNIEEN